MKLYCQCGSGPGTKASRGFEEQVIDGIIVGPKEHVPGTLRDMLESLTADFPHADILFDPQYYALNLPQNSKNRFGHMEKFKQWPNFHARRTEAYLRDRENVVADIGGSLSFQETLPTTRLVAPNIVVNRSLDSRLGQIAETFIVTASEVHKDLGLSKPLLCTLAVGAETLSQTEEVQRLANTLISLPNPPAGFYLLVETSGDPSDLYDARRYGNLLFLIYSLKLNGFEVVWGYSDILGAIATCAGLDAASSGWFGTLRSFSTSRFAPAEGMASRPRTKYFSVHLKNRILLAELRLARRLAPQIFSSLATDAPYVNGGEIIDPEDDTEKCLQSWGGLTALIQAIGSQELEVDAIDRALLDCEEAWATYQELRSRAVRFEPDTSSGHLRPIIEGLQELKDEL